MVARVEHLCDSEWLSSRCRKHTCLSPGDIPQGGLSPPWLSGHWIGRSVSKCNCFDLKRSKTLRAKTPPNCPLGRCVPCIAAHARAPRTARSAEIWCWEGWSGAERKTCPPAPTPELDASMHSIVCLKMRAMYNLPHSF